MRQEDLNEQMEVYAAVERTTSAIGSVGLAVAGVLAIKFGEQGFST